MSKCLWELADVHYGKSPNEVLREDSPIPIIGTGGVYGRASRAMYNGPAVVVPRKGSLGNPQYVGEPFWPVDTTYAVIPKTGVDAKWLYYSLAAFDLTKLNEATGVPSINRDWLYRIKLGSDQFDGQRRIAEILSTVDEAIEQTEALIAKYQQIKAGLMHDLFTRGVTPDGRLRPTRAEAPQLYKESPLGWIPKEWEVQSLRHFVPIVAYGVSSGLGENPSGIPVLRMNNLTAGRIDITDIKFSDAVEARLLTLKVGDVIFNRTNSLEHVGKTAMWRGELAAASFASYLVRLDVDVQKMRSAYLVYWLNLPSTQIAIRRFATPGVHQVNINPTNLRRMECAAPKDLVEQDTIARRVEQLEKFINNEELHVAKLRQQKQGLMQDLLTGRVRVTVAESKEASS